MAFQQIAQRNCNSTKKSCKARRPQDNNDMWLHGTALSTTFLSATAKPPRIDTT